MRIDKAYSTMPPAVLLTQQVQNLLKDANIPKNAHAKCLHEKASCQMNEYLKVANWKTLAVDTCTLEHNAHLVELLSCLHNAAQPARNVSE